MDVPRLLACISGALAHLCRQPAVQLLLAASENWSAEGKQRQQKWGLPSQLNIDRSPSGRQHRRLCPRSCVLGAAASQSTTGSLSPKVTDRLSVKYGRMTAGVLAEFCSPPLGGKVKRLWHGRCFAVNTWHAKLTRLCFQNALAATSGIHTGSALSLSKQSGSPRSLDRASLELWHGRHFFCLDNIPRLEPRGTHALLGFELW